MNFSAAELPQASSSASISVRVASASDRERWEAFVERCPEATFFHQFGWKDVIEQVFAQGAP